MTALALGATAFAQAPGKGGPALPSLTKQSHFEALKAGDRVALVCKASDTITVIDIKDQKAALELCREGRMVHCPVCKKDYKVIWTNPSGKSGGPKTSVAIVNESGEPCMFFARLS